MILTKLYTQVVSWHSMTEIAGEIELWASPPIAFNRCGVMRCMCRSINTLHTFILPSDFLLNSTGLSIPTQPQ